MERKFVLRAFIACICMAFVYQEAAAQKVYVKGKVVTKDGVPVSDVDVVIPKSTFRTVTDSAGSFHFANLNKGAFDIVIVSVGSKPLVQHFPLSEKDTLFASFALPIKSAQLEDVKVTSFASRIRVTSDDLGKMSMTNLENPQVYSVVSKTLLAEQNVTTIQQALTNVTGATVSVSPAGGVSIMSRGFSTSIGARNGMPYVGVDRSSLDPANIEAIEVLKGPSGTLFGKVINSYGGLVNLVTKKPHEMARSEIGYTVGTYGLQRLTADVNAPLNKEKTVLFRANAAVNKQGSFYNAGHNNRLFFAPSVSYQVNNKLKVSLDVEAYREDVTKPQYISDYSALNLKTLKDLPFDYKQSFFDNSFNALASNLRTYAQAEYKISSNWTSSTNVAIINEELQRSYQGYIYFTNKDSVRLMGGDFGPISTYSSDIQQNFKGDVTLLGMRHRILIGADYYNYNSKRNSRGTRNLYSVNFRSVSRLVSEQDMLNAYVGVTTSNSVTANEVVSGYVSDLVNITKQLMVLASIRYDRYMSKGAGGYNQASWAPRFGLVYQPVPDVVSIFGNYTSGFTNYNTGIQPDGSLFFYKPSYANQWETGVKLNLMHNKLVASASYYDIAIDDAPRSDQAKNLFQDGQQKSKGWEIDIKANPIQQLSITAGYVNNQNKYIRAAAASEGKLTVASPKSVANLWASYRFTQNSVLKNFGIGAGANYVGESFFDANNTVILPSYTVITSSIFYDAAAWRLGLAVNNLTSEKYWNATGTPQIPRNITFSTAFKF